MIAWRLAAALAVLLMACQPAASPVSNAPAFAPRTLHFGDSGLVSFPAGRYSFRWTSTCSSLAIELAPTSGATPIPVGSSPIGATSLDVPAGAAYVNRSGSCPASDLELSIASAG